MTDSSGPRRSAASRRRSAARLAAVQALYEIELSAAPADAVVRDFVQNRMAAPRGLVPDEEGAGEGAIAGADTGLFTRVVRGSLEKRRELDEMIQGALSKGWTMERLEAVLRNILRAGAFELAAETNVPPKVAISEYVDVAHAFYSGPEPGMVNAVLDKIAHVVRPTEFDHGRSLP